MKQQLNRVKNMTKKQVAYLAAAILLAIVVTNSGFMSASSSEARVLPVVRAEDRAEILWLARILYSETKDPTEQYYVAWVARNRLDTNFRGAESYKDVALAPAQFSGMHATDAQYKINISRNYDSGGDSWEGALATAELVYYSFPVMRPFPETVRHFYSPISVRSAPEWSEENEPYMTIEDEDGDIRFAFHKGIK